MLDGSANASRYCNTLPRGQSTWGGGRSATALFQSLRDRGSSVAATCRPSSSSPATPVHRIEGVQLPSTHPRPLFLSLSVHSPSPSRRHGRSLSSSRSPADFASSPPWISNPPHPKLNHLPSFLLNLSNHSHNPHLAGNPGFPGRRLGFRPNLTSPWNSIARPSFLSSKSLNRL